MSDCDFDTLFTYVITFIGLNWAAIIITILILNVFIQSNKR